MAILTELGTQFPCTTQGVEIDLSDDTLEMYSGEVLEAWFIPEAGREIKPGDSLQFVQDFLKLKEKYPQFVLHYVKVESFKITVQYSVAPMGAKGNSPVHIFIALIILGILIIVGSCVLTKKDRGYLFTPTGTAGVKARNTDTARGISGVRMYCDGEYIGTTDGYTVNTMQLVGEHIFSANPIEGYLDPYPVTALIELNKNIVVTIDFWPEDIPVPTTGWIDVFTTPAGAKVYINADLVGVSPIAVEVNAPGDYTIGFGDLEGYITPEARTASVVPGARTPIKVTYLTPEEAPWEKYVMYGLMAAAVIAGTALAVPPIIKALKSKEEP